MTTIHSILLVEDDIDLCESIKELLEGEGFSVRAANNGRQGMQLLNEQAADLVVSDIFMPEMDGLEFITLLRQRFQKIKILIMSGGARNLQADYLFMAKSLGADAIMKKPFSSAKLLAEIANLSRMA